MWVKERTDIRPYGSLRQQSEPLFEAEALPGGSVKRIGNYESDFQRHRPIFSLVAFTRCRPERKSCGTMPRSLITGGAGFMGSHVARECMALGHDVVVLDDLSGGFPENVPEQAEFIQGDVSDPAAVAEVFRK